MKVLHLELPRELSFSLKPWRYDFHEVLAQLGHHSRQVDLNPRFWSWVLGEGLWGRLLDVELAPHTYGPTMRAVSALTRQLEHPRGALTVGGLHFDAQLVNDTHALSAWVHGERLAPWLEHWWEALDAELELSSAWDVISFGVGSQSQLALAAAFASRLSAANPELHTCLSHHQWENYALADRLPKLIASGALLELFDSVVLQQEDMGGALTGLMHALATGELTQLQNIALSVSASDVEAPAQRRLFPRVGGTTTERPFTTGAGLSEYIASSGLEPSQTLYLDALVRNDCYYGKCTFCVQNVGYVRRQNYKFDAELARIAAVVEHLATVDGVKTFSFVDQAVPQALLARWSKLLLSRGLTTNWCVRMLADAHDAELLSLAAQAGCREILFGVESVHGPTLERLDKRTTASDPEALHALVERMAATGLDATLNFIRGIPSEPVATFEATTQRFIEQTAQRHRNVTVILNAFGLFADAPMAKAPALHGIEEVIAAGGDLEQLFDHRDAHWGRGSQHVIPEALAFAATGVDGSNEDPGLVADLRAVNYSSIALLFRWRTGRWLAGELSAVAPPLEHLVFGSTGYLGHNLGLRLASPATALTSTRRPRRRLVNALHTAQDLAEDHWPLLELSPKTIWLAARPADGDFETSAAFRAHLQSLIRAWSEQGTLERIVLFSSQLVMATPRAGARASGRSPLAPEDDYGAHLAQMELFVGSLTRMQLPRPLSVDVVRLPLLWGGVMVPRHVSAQFLSVWRAQLEQGRRWRITSEEEAQFGNSWVDVSDLIDALLPDPGPGLRVRTVKSGDFRYAQLQADWESRQGPAATDAEPIPLPRTCFLVDDELALPARELTL